MIDQTYEKIKIHSVLSYAFEDFSFIKKNKFINSYSFIPSVLLSSENILLKLKFLQ